MSALEIIVEREGSHYVALISTDSEVIEVSREFGSWQTIPDESGRRRDVMPKVAVTLQEHVKRYERMQTCSR